MKKFRLTELDPQFLKRTDDSHWQHVERIGEADGIIFLCPACFEQNNGPVGTHSIICWRPSVPQSTSPTPGRWEFEGNGYYDLTLAGGAWSGNLRSVKLDASCNVHFHITNGEVHP